MNEEQKQEKKQTNIFGFNFIQSNFILFLSAFIAIMALAAVNFYSIKTMSALKAGTYGETEYVKARIDETRTILEYINTGEDKYLQAFRASYTIHKSFNNARMLISTGASDSLVRQALLTTGNDSQDVNDILFLIRSMGKFSFVKKSMADWATEDRDVKKLDLFISGLQILIRSGKMTPKQQVDLYRNFLNVTERLPQTKTRFSAILGNASRSISKFVFYSNILLIILIAGIVAGIWAKILLRVKRGGILLFEQNQVLLRTNIELDRFVYSASHDLRSPLASIRGLIEILQEDATTEQQLYLGMMEECIERQDRYIKEIINFSVNHVEENNYSRVDLMDLLDEVIKCVSESHPQNGLTITREIHISTIICDKEKLKIILGGILTNAVQFSDPMKFEEFILIQIRAVENQIEIAMTDNGMGIKPEIIHQIFDMFFVNNHINRGSGVGLYNVKRTVEKMGGSIRVSSVLGSGSKFTVILPVLENEQL